MRSSWRSFQIDEEGRAPREVLLPGVLEASVNPDRHRIPARLPATRNSRAKGKTRTSPRSPGP